MKLDQNIMSKKLLQYLLLFFLIFVILSTVSGLLAKLEGKVYKSYSWGALMVDVLIRYGIKFLYIIGSIVFIRFLFHKNLIKEWMQWVLHMTFGIGLTFYSVSSQIIINNWIYDYGDPFTFDYIYSSALIGTDYNFFLYFSMIAITYAYYFFKKQKNYELKESQLKTQLLDSKINALQSQLQPHFLFNALNDISSLIEINPEKSQDAIADLSELLRQTLELKDTKLIPLSEEIAILQKYLDIEKLRFDENLNFTLDLPNDVDNILVPPLLLQPVVENSIKHGFSYQHDSLDIRISIEEVTDYLQFTIANNGANIIENEMVYGTGLSNVIARLDTLYDGDFYFEMKNDVSKGKGVITQIRIPLG